jgi:alkanesulfonate monooxygenase SsuD/methylene tetrahydromethanopterin reductase-like flavin-dependent oxidoreductase (luciferase family)
MQIGAWVAARTSRIRIGSAIVIAPFHHPLRLAEEAATLDRLSGGRLDLGLGRGYQRAEFEAYGVEMDEARQRTHETLEILQRAFTQRTFEYHGRHYQIPETELLPKPVQQPRPPIYWACLTPPSYRYAAEQGLGVLVTYAAPWEERHRMWAEYARTMQAKGLGDRVATSPLFYLVYCGETTQEARQLARDSLISGSRDALLYGSSRAVSPDYALYDRFDRLRREMADKEYDDAYFDDRHGPIVGTPDECAQRLRWLIEDNPGLDHVLCRFGFGDVAHERVVRSMTLFAREVMPRFQ